MRKMYITREGSFNPYLLLRIKDGDEKREFKEPCELKSQKYTAEEERRIASCNSILIKNFQSEMDEEETEYFINPTPTDPPTNDELQELAGFSVEKKITYKTE